MSVITSEAVPAKTPRRPASKTPKIQAEKALKLSIYLTPESARRLGVTAACERSTQSAVIEALIREHLRRWVVADRRGKSDGQAIEMVEGSALAAA
jgi:hypothetical protein